MALPQTFYLNHLFKETGYRANWLPNKPIRIGDVGKIEHGLFTLYTTLEQQGIDLEIRESDSDLNLDYTSNDSVTIEMETQMSNNSALSSLAKGNIKIKFAQKNGLIFKMSGVKKQVLGNLAIIQKRILQEYKNKLWPKEWVIITETVKADDITVIISTSENNEIDLSCDISIQSPAVNLANPKLNLSLVREVGSSTKILGANNLTPLFQLSGIYHPIWSTPEFKYRSDPTVEIEMLKIEEFTYDMKETDLFD